MRILWSLLLVPLLAGCAMDDDYHNPYQGGYAAPPQDSSVQYQYPPASACSAGGFRSQPAMTPPVSQTQEPPR